MARITVNPNAEAKSGFDVIKAGTYPMRIKEVRTTDDNGQPFVSEKGNTTIKVQLEYINPTELEKEDSSGYAKSPGTLFDNGLVVSPPEGQGRLRQFVEALGLNWANFDTDDLQGMEVGVVVKVETYNGEKRNAVKRYVKL